MYRENGITLQKIILVWGTASVLVVFEASAGISPATDNKHADVFDVEVVKVRKTCMRDRKVRVEEAG